MHIQINALRIGMLFGIGIELGIGMLTQPDKNNPARIITDINNATTLLISVSIYSFALLVNY